MSASLGTDIQGPLAARYGGAVGENFHYRVYAKAADRDPQFHPDGADHDIWRMAQGGFRGDWTLPKSRALTVQADVYGGRLGQRVSAPQYAPPFAQVSVRESPLSGGNVLARLGGRLGSGEYQVHTYYARTRRDERPVAETRDTFDLDVQQRQRLGERQNIVFGAGYRITSGRISATAPTQFVPSERTDHLYTAFVQDDIAIVPARLRLVLGAKMEHNAYSGFEFQPSGRVGWTIDATNTLFAAATRAVRTPSRVETDYHTTSLANPAVPAFVRLQPNPDFEAEELTAYEVGYRMQPHPSLYLTTAGFFNHLDNTLSTELLSAFVETSPGTPRLILPVTFANGLHGNSHGVEVSADARVTPWWRWTANYSYLRVQMTRDADSADVSQERRYEGLSPRHQVQLQSSIDLPRSVFLDWFLRYASELRAGSVPAYSTSNLRLSWRPTAQFEIALVGRDLHAARHVEWPSDAGPRLQIRRSGYVNVIWRP